MAYFLPTTAKEVKALGWDYVDIILFTGDAYIDHPSFGAAVIGRSLEAAGYRVAIVPQPNWQDDLRDFRKLGVPRLFFGVTAGAMDSTVMHYTPTGRLRSDDAYTPEGRAGARPDYPTIVYTRILKELYPDSLVVLGGIEASLRRLAHYDYIQKGLRPSFLVESGADAIIYGMGERAVVDFAHRVSKGQDWQGVENTVYLSDSVPNGAILLNSFEDCKRDAKKFAQNFVEIEKQSNVKNPTTLVEPTGGRNVVVNPVGALFSQKECDRTYALPYMRSPAPKYRGKRIIAWEMIRDSVNIHRGCYGGCSFCAISMHQGKFIVSRSEESVVAEVEKVIRTEGFRGTITDVGGPSANMWRSECRTDKGCTRPSCLVPRICPNLKTNHKGLLGLYSKIEKIEGIKHLYIGSGIRYDIPLDWQQYLDKVVRHHTPGRLKVAPEHTEEYVVDLMRKPHWEKYQKLETDFRNITQRYNLPYVLVPYFISAHPGCNQNDMQRLKGKTRGVLTNQVQDFTPTPMTLSSVMFHCGFDPYTLATLYVARTKADKDQQKSFFFDKNQQKKGTFVQKIGQNVKPKNGRQQNIPREEKRERTPRQSRRTKRY